MAGLASLALLLADAVPAAVLDAWLAAAEAAYTHVEAECRFATGAVGAPGTVIDETFVGSWGRGHALFSDPPAASVFVGQPRAWLVNPGYSAMATKPPRGGWTVVGIQPPAPGYTLHPHAPCGPPYDTVSYRSLVARRVGRLTLAAGGRDGRPGWTAVVPVGPPPGRTEGRHRLTLTLSAAAPVLVRAAVVERTDVPDGEARWCEISYQPAAAGDWPAVRSVRVWTGSAPSGGEQTAEFTRYTRLADPPADDRFTLAAVGLPPPTTIPARPTVFAAGVQTADAADEEPQPQPEEEPDGRWQWWAIGGILVVGAVAFALVGLRPAGKG